MDESDKFEKCDYKLRQRKNARNCHNLGLHPHQCGSAMVHVYRKKLNIRFNLTMRSDAINRKIMKRKNV